MKREISAFTIGNACFLTIPGEIYPEIVYRGIEAPEGQDSEIQPVEIPPLVSFMPGKYHLVMGLTNNEIGYIIPKSEWDSDPPGNTVLPMSIMGKSIHWALKQEFYYIMPLKKFCRI